MSKISTKLIIFSAVLRRIIYRAVQIKPSSSWLKSGQVSAEVVSQEILTMGSKQHILIFPMASQMLTKSVTLVGEIGAWWESKLGSNSMYLESKKLTRWAANIRNTEDVVVAAEWGAFNARADTSLAWLEAGRDGEGASN
jgi:hypothetical protein